MNYQRRRSERIGIEKQAYEDHLIRLQNIQHVVDCRYTGPKVKPIQRYADENNRFKRRTDKENASLISRLAKVKSGTVTHHHISVIRQLRWQQYLRHVERINRLKRITKQNERLLKGIQTIKPTIDLSCVNIKYGSQNRPHTDGKMCKYRSLKKIKSKWDSFRPVERQGKRINNVTFQLPDIIN